MCISRVIERRFIVMGLVYMPYIIYVLSYTILFWYEKKGEYGLCIRTYTKWIKKLEDLNFVFLNGEKKVEVSKSIEVLNTFNEKWTEQLICDTQIFRQFEIVH